MDNSVVLYSLKTPGNQRFSGVLRGSKMRTLSGNGLRNYWNVIETKHIAHLPLFYQILPNLLGGWSHVLILTVMYFEF